MGRWFRLDDDVVNDPKVQNLSDGLFRAWVNILCIASKNDGVLPPLRDVAFTLRMKEAAAAGVLSKLHLAGLLDKTEISFKPHNWEGRQFKSDRDATAAERSKRYRDGKRDRHASVTRDATETSHLPEAETDSVASATGAEAPDPRKRLFNEGLAKLASLTGKGPDACRSFVGKCLRAAADDAVIVLGLIEDAERNQVVDPSAWIAARLKGPENGKPKSAIIQAADDLVRQIAGFDGPARSGDDLRRIPREASTRLLSHGGS